MYYSTEILLAIISGISVVSVIIFKKATSARRNPPSLPWLPVVGSLPFLSGFDKFQTFLTEKTKRYGNVYSFYAGRRYTVVLNGYEALREALVKRSADFAGREKVYAEHLVWNPELRGIIFRQYGNDFKIIRKKSMTVFKQLGLGEKATMEAKIHKEINECIITINKKKDQAFDIEPLFRRFALSIVYRMMFGRKLELDDGEFISKAMDEYEKSVDPVLDLFVPARFLPKYRQLIRNVVAASAKFKRLIQNKLKECLSDSSCDEEIFVKEFWRSAQSDFDESELYYVAKDFIAAGVNTTSTQLLWSILMITNRPTLQGRLQKEIDSVVPRERLPSITDKLPYLEATILETMRLKTAIPLSLPHTTMCDTEVAGFTIPKDTQIVVNLWSAHMDPNVWKEPELFRPERFLNEDGAVINRDLVISFSLGKRSCPGEILARQEMFLNLATLLQQFEFLPPLDQVSIPETGLMAFVYSPANFKVRVIPRAS